jgi:soluble lytic murein transglycosylase-like protein
MIRFAAPQHPLPTPGFEEPEKLTSGARALRLEDLLAEVLARSVPGSPDNDAVNRGRLRSKGPGREARHAWRFDVNASSRSSRPAGSAVALRAYGAAKSALALVGLAAVAVLAVPGPRDSFLRDLPLPALLADPLAVTSTVAAGPIQASERESAQEREQRAVSESIAKRYRVAEDAIAGFVSLAYRAGHQFSVDPMLILAVMAIESRYNPVAESVLGARGLMQVMPRFHLEKLLEHGGEQALLDPEVNIFVGTQILREYLRRFGEVETALQMYGGAFDEPTSQYAGKVLAEKARLDSLRQKARRQSA